MVVSCLESITHVPVKYSHLYPCLVWLYTLSPPCYLAADTEKLASKMNSCEFACSLKKKEKENILAWNDTDCRCRWQKERSITCDSPLQLALHKVGSVPPRMRRARHHRLQEQSLFQWSLALPLFEWQFTLFPISILLCSMHLSRLHWQLCSQKALSMSLAHIRVSVNEIQTW